MSAGEILRRAFELVTERAEDFALLMTLEMGKPLAEARGEVTYGAEFLRWFSEEAVRAFGRYSVSPDGKSRLLVTKKPVGPCLLITPWNFPLAMATRKIAPAVAAGCTMVLKSANLTPLTSQLFAAVMHGGRAARRCPERHPDVHGRCHHGSADQGLRGCASSPSPAPPRWAAGCSSDASETVLRTSMELGGNAPFVVFEDADVDAAVAGAMLAKLRNMGEACTAANRFIVHESVADEFAEKFAAKMADMTTARGTEAESKVGPLIDAKSRDKVHELVTDAVAAGAVAVIGGAAVEGPGYFYQPTILKGVTEGTRILSEEIFGPVAPIITFDTEDEAVRLANNTEYGLVAYVFTRDLNRGIRMGERLETGMLGLNAGVVSNAAAPSAASSSPAWAAKAASKASRNTSTPSTSASPTPTPARTTRLTGPAQLRRSQPATRRSAPRALTRHRATAAPGALCCAAGGPERRRGGRRQTARTDGGSHSARNRTSGPAWARSDCGPRAIRGAADPAPQSGTARSSGCPGAGRRRPPGRTAGGRTAGVRSPRSGRLTARWPAVVQAVRLPEGARGAQPCRRNAAASHWSAGARRSPWRGRAVPPRPATAWPPSRRARAPSSRRRRSAAATSCGDASSSPRSSTAPAPYSTGSHGWPRPPGVPRPGAAAAPALGSGVGEGPSARDAVRRCFRFVLAPLGAWRFRGVGRNHAARGRRLERHPAQALEVQFRPGMGVPGIDLVLRQGTLARRSTPWRRWAGPGRSRRRCGWGFPPAGPSRPWRRRSGCSSRSSGSGSPPARTGRCRHSRPAPGTAASR